MAEKRDNRLATVLALALLAMILMLTGAPGLVNRNPPHDEASTAAIPYTLAGQDEYWRAEYRIEAADPAADDTVSVDFAYQAVFTLAYLGDEADLAGRRRADLHVRDLGDLGEVGLAGAIDQLEDALPRGDAGGNGGGQLRAALRPRDVQLAGVVNESDGDVHAGHHNPRPHG